MNFSAQRLLLVYSATCTVLVVALFASGYARPVGNTFDEITVHRINIVEPDGTLRMVVSNHARLPGVIVRGKEEAPDRPYAGMIFYNDEGSENGGLVFGGKKDTKGEVTDSGGSLTFDKYDANQIVQLAGVDDKEDRFAGLAVSDSVPGGKNHRRVWVGRGEDGVSTINLMDAQGRKRIALEVTPEGRPRILFLGATGKVVKELTVAEKN